jgi:hypothetical protein
LQPSLHWCQTTKPTGLLSSKTIGRVGLGVDNKKIIPTIQQPIKEKNTATIVWKPETIYKPQIEVHKLGKQQKNHLPHRELPKSINRPTFVQVFVYLANLGGLKEPLQTIARRAPTSTQ